MSAITQKTTQKPEAATVLSKTFACAGERLDISRTLLAKLPGVSPATITGYMVETHRLHYVEVDLAMKIKAGARLQELITTIYRYYRIDAVL